MARTGRTAGKRAPLWMRAVLVGLIIANVIAVLGVINDAPLYGMLRVPFAPIVRLALAGAWTITFGFLLVDLTRRRTWAFRWCAPLVTVYAVVGLVWLMIFARADYDQGRIAAQAVLSAIILTPFWFVALRGGWLRLKTTPTPGDVDRKS